MEDPSARFLDDVGHYIVAELSPAIASFLALMIFTRWFGPGAFGRYSITMTAVAIVVTIGYGWLEQAILRYHTADDEGLSSVFGTAVVISTIVLLVGFGLFRSGIFSLSAYRQFYLVGVVLVVTQGLFRTLRAIHQAELAPSLLSQVEFAQALTKLALAVGIALVVQSIVGWIIAGVVTSTLGSIWLLARLQTSQTQFGAWSFARSRQQAIQLLAFGLPMIGFLLGYSVLTFLDRFLIEIFFTSDVVGRYAANYDLATRGLLLVFTPIIQTAHPLIMSEWQAPSQKAVQTIIDQYVRYFLVVGVPAVVGMSLVSYPLSGAVLSEQFQAGAIVIPFVAIGLFLWNLGMLLHKPLEIREQTSRIVGGVAIAVVLNLGLNLVLIPRYGSLGAALATMVSFGTYPLFVTFISRERFAWNHQRRTLGNVSIGVGMIAIVFVALWLTGLYMRRVALLGIPIAALLYGVTLYRLGEVRPEEKEVLLERLGPS